MEHIAYDYTGEALIRRVRQLRGFMRDIAADAMTADCSDVMGEHVGHRLPLNIR